MHAFATTTCDIVESILPNGNNLSPSQFSASTNWSTLLLLRKSESSNVSRKVVSVLPPNLKTFLLRFVLRTPGEVCCRLLDAAGDASTKATDTNAALPVSKKSWIIVSNVSFFSDPSVATAGKRDSSKNFQQLQYQVQARSTSRKQLTRLSTYVSVGLGSPSTMVVEPWWFSIFAKRLRRKTCFCTRYRSLRT